MRATTKNKEGIVTDIFNGSAKDYFNMLVSENDKIISGMKKDTTKAKQLLLESSLIAKDMEILVLKEKLKELSLLQLKTNRMLNKIPNWIKWFFK